MSDATDVSDPASQQVPRDDEVWQRLHPLTPIARIGRIVPALVLLALVSLVHSGAENRTAETDYLVVFTLLSALYGYVHWMVTRWRFEGDTLRIETGLIRKDSRRLPLARIQAVDIVRPLLARLLGVAELRVRLAGSGSTDGRLAYLSEAQATELRVILLAGHADTGTPVSPNTGLPMATVSLGPLIGSVLLSLISIVLVGTIAALTVLDQFAPHTAGAAAGFLAVYMLSFAGVVWRRLSGQYNFVAIEGPEGVRIRRGLLQTVSESVPYGRIQAVRQVEPLLWRPFGWCRLEVDVAGATARNQRGEGTGVVRKAILPVGSQQASWHLLARLLGGPDPERTPPPRRARWKAPLSFHFLSAGHDGVHAMCVTGRINRTTTWVPLDKTQSVRRVQGPAQRPLGLATVHVDVAGRRARAEFRDRTVEEADRLVAELTAQSRAARLAPRPAPPVRAGAVAGDGTAPSGWYADPSGQHEQRYWHEGQWTAQVADGGRRRS
ncbi:MAG TPA: PH domain-containing protein [Acidimicrobiales bacterium]|nr:PH domain-containing protein [Acidimicrobiales bacterium]